MYKARERDPGTAIVITRVPEFQFALLWTAEKRPPDQQMQVTEIRIPARNQPISSLRCDYITQATKQVRNADRENNRYCNGNVVEQLHDQLASSIGKGTALSSNEKGAELPVAAPSFRNVNNVLHILQAGHHAGPPVSCSVLLDTARHIETH